MVLTQLWSVVSESSALELQDRIWEAEHEVLVPVQVLVPQLVLPRAVECLPQDHQEVEVAEVVPAVPLSPSCPPCRGSYCRRRCRYSVKSFHDRRQKSPVSQTVKLTNSVIMLIVLVC